MDVHIGNNSEKSYKTMKSYKKIEIEARSLHDPVSDKGPVGKRNDLWSSIIQDRILNTLSIPKQWGKKNHILPSVFSAPPISVRFAVAWVFSRANTSIK